LHCMLVNITSQRSYLLLLILRCVFVLSYAATSLCYVHIHFAIVRDVQVYEQSPFRRKYEEDKQDNVHTQELHNLCFPPNVRVHMSRMM
jgi:hypothetical protein